MASTTAIRVDDDALGREKEALKRKKVQERSEKKFRIAARAQKKNQLEAALAEKMSAQTGKKRKFPVTKVAPALSAQRLLAKKKTTIGMYFNRGNIPLIELSNLNVPSDPISSDSNSEEPGSFAVSPEVITVSDDTLPPLSTDGSDVVVLGSNTGTNSASSDNLDFELRSLRELSLSEDDLDDEEESLLPLAKKRKPNYDAARKFQMVWAAKLPWAEAVLATDGVLQMVKCTTCSIYNKKPCILAPKWDTLKKHEGYRIADRDMPGYNVKKGQSYVANNCRHKKNMHLHMSKPTTTVLQQQINSAQSLERDKKKVQFASLFQILSFGRSVSEYESRYKLYDFLGVPNNPTKHWSDSSSWVMVEFMFAQVQASIIKEVRVADFVAISADETSTIDNGSWISIHAYVVKNWVRVPFLISLQRVKEGTGADNLTSVIVKALESGGGLDSTAISSKLLCFGADGVSAFQGIRTGVTKQLQDKWVAFMSAMHDMAHRCNLAYKVLSELGVFQSIEGLLKKTYAYFSHSPKRHLEFVKLAEVMETKGLKLLKNVQTCWVSLLEPLRRLLAQYRVVLAKMVEDYDDNKEARNFTHDVIHLKWVEDLNDGTEHLAFMVNGDKLFAKHAALGSATAELVDRITWQALVNRVKCECTSAASQLKDELQDRFPDHAVFDAMGIVYPQYWAQPDAEANFHKHLNILKGFYCEPKSLGSGDDERMIQPPLDGWKLEAQQGLFKTSMLANWQRCMEPPFDTNPVTRLWRLLDASSLCRTMFSEYFKLAQVAIVHVLGSVEDERCFSSLTFLKDKLRNSLDVHLPLVVGMYSQKLFTLETFPFDATFDAWMKGAEKHGRYAVTA